MLRDAMICYVYHFAYVFVCEANRADLRPWYYGVLIGGSTVMAPAAIAASHSRCKASPNRNLINVLGSIGGRMFEAKMFAIFHCAGLASIICRLW